MLPVATSSANINGYMEWLRNTLLDTEFGEVGIRFIVHQGLITRVCKTIEVPEKMGVPIKFTVKIGEANGD
jgi:hypothetical protein